MGSVGLIERTEFGLKLHRGKRWAVLVVDSHFVRLGDILPISDLGPTRTRLALENGFLVCELRGVDEAILGIVVTHRDPGPKSYGSSPANC